MKLELLGYRKSLAKIGLENTKWIKKTVERLEVGQWKYKLVSSHLLKEEKKMKIAVLKEKEMDGGQVGKEVRI